MSSNLTGFKGSASPHVSQYISEQLTANKQKIHNVLDRVNTLEEKLPEGTVPVLTHEASVGAFGPLDTHTHIGGVFKVHNEKYAAQVSSSFDNKTIINELTLGRGHHVRVTDASKLQMIDQDNNVVFSSQLGSEPAFPDLVYGAPGVVDLMANGKSGWDYVGGAHQVDFIVDGNNKSFRILGNDNTADWVFGAPIADVTPEHLNTWFGTNAEYGNFQLQMDVKLHNVSGYTNGGIIPRAWQKDATVTYRDLQGNMHTKTGLHHCTGIQCEVSTDVFANGQEYDEGWAGNKYIVQNNRANLSLASGQFITPEQAAILCPTDQFWTYKIECRDWVIKSWIEDTMVSKYYEDVQDNDAVARKVGKIAVQGHVSFGGVGNTGSYLEYRNIRMKPLTDESTATPVSHVKMNADVEISGNLKNKYKGRSYDCDIAGINFSSVFVGDFGNVDYRVKFSFNYDPVHNSKVYMEIYDKNSSDVFVVAELYNPSYNPYTNTFTSFKSQPIKFIPVSAATLGAFGLVLMEPADSVSYVNLTFSEDFSNITSGSIDFQIGQYNTQYAPYVYKCTISSGSSIQDITFKPLSAPELGIGANIESLPATLPAKVDNVQVHKPALCVSTFPLVDFYFNEFSPYHALNLGNFTRGASCDYLELWDQTILYIDTIEKALKFKYFCDRNNVKITGILCDHDFDWLSTEGQSAAPVSVAERYPWDRQKAIDRFAIRLPIWKALGCEYGRVNLDSRSIDWVSPTSPGYQAAHDEFVACAAAGLTTARDLLQQYGLKMLIEPHQTNWTFSAQILIDIFNALPDKTDIGVCYDVHNAEGNGNPYNVNMNDELELIMPYVAVLNLKTLGFYTAAEATGTYPTDASGFILEDGMRVPRHKDQGNYETRYDWNAMYRLWRSSNMLSFDKFPIATMEPEWDLNDGHDKRMAIYTEIANYHRRAIANSYN